MFSGVAVVFVLFVFDFDSDQGGFFVVVFQEGLSSFLVVIDGFFGLENLGLDAFELCLPDWDEESEFSFVFQKVCLLFLGAAACFLVLVQGFEVDFKHVGHFLDVFVVVDGVGLSLAFGFFHQTF